MPTSQIADPTIALTIIGPPTTPGGEIVYGMQAWASASDAGIFPGSYNSPCTLYYTDTPTLIFKLTDRNNIIIGFCPCTEGAPSLTVKIKRSRYSAKNPAVVSELFVSGLAAGYSYAILIQDISSPIGMVQFSVLPTSDWNGSFPPFSEDPAGPAPRAENT
ncbi:hypothetical protein [Synoicihabitans lomoniglobus]|uniref:Uncharacterized protein n=1 Tax=Synoicihabitans lomoniglobus TaxID=2909285 RepID=A0AAF0CR39_9BACT|nr:hypothetical protein [Opitutaceae bacterium LMO-M01]WED66534.1 hypothetical protein PXH66_06685 [Opitutaceae bacterium LMO-M01]